MLTTSVSAKPPARHKPFCDLVANDLHFKRGNVNYLPAYGKVMDLFRRRPNLPWPEMYKILWQHPKRISALVYALNHASHVAALRDRFLLNTTLPVGPAIPNPHHWNYGSGFGPMSIAGYLSMRSGEYYVAGHQRRGAQYALAATLLSSQMTPVGGRFLVLLLSVHMLTAKLDRKRISSLPVFSGVPTTVKDMAAYGLRSVITFFGTAARRTTFLALYKKVKAQRDRAAHFCGPLDKLYHAESRGPDKLTIQQKHAMRRIINQGFAACVDIHQVFYVLSNSQYLQQRAMHSHRRWIANAIRSDLAQGLSNLLKARRFSHRDRQLIEAWIFDLAREP